MAQAFRILKSTYRDSVSLMQLSAKIARLPGIARASLVMATTANLALLEQAGVLRDTVQADPNDLLVHVDGESDATVERALSQAAAELAAPPTGVGGGSEAKAAPVPSLERAIASLPQANLALVSVPGAYAAAEAMKALRLGANVMLFSDNVALEDEVMLKRLAREKQLLVMGPDCGTAIIGGVPLGFANQVRRGKIGCISASGTGLQQVTSLVHRLGGGISQAIGIGGRDLGDEVGGIAMLQALQLLGEDAGTSVVVLISKPPHARVAAQVLAEAAALGKPVVVCFLGATLGQNGNLHPVRTLDQAARVACTLSGRHLVAETPRWRPAAARMQPQQRYVRGLYCGGTFCYEASLLLSETVSPVWSNTPVGQARPSADPWLSREHSLVDLGDDAFTRGRPHPMIDHRLRNERFVAEAADPEVAVLLFDVVLGYGAHPDPAAEMAGSLQAAREAAAKGGRDIALIGFVCGTEEDPQDLARQETALQLAGVTLAASNEHAVRLAAAVAAGQPAIDAPLR